jgi:putative membrane-bound dehydrogenase-like protein
LLAALAPLASHAADGLQSKTTYSKAYGATKNAVAVDPAKDLPRYPAVAPRDAIATWQVKPGFKLELAAHEPQVRDPIALCFDERGRMFVCEMIDYSEMRDVKPHLGRVSMLEDKDGDGYYETSVVFADDLPWPTGLIWANGGLYVGATPDIWRFEDRDGDGRADVREKVFTGFGTGLKLLNVQGLMNSFQWGQDNRVHVLAGGGNRGEIQCLKRPELPAQELGGRDFWFDPRTHEFGLEVGGAQYGMSFDDFGRKFGCSNSDHLQYWVHNESRAGLPPPRKSIAVDGGAAEVFRLSPDEPWRIIRTRWRIAGVVKGSVEGGGRVSGYFTGATGTTVYRGDAYGPEFVNNTFSGDAGGQLVHRKIIRPAEDGVSLVGERPADERGFEFAASKDTWVRVVNFANAPDGCLHLCDMYREVIEHPWSIPDEIKQHLDLNSGNDRGRIYRIVPTRADWQRRANVNLANATTAELVETLTHANGWHRDTATRLLDERQDRSAVPLLGKLLTRDVSPAAKLHALSALDGLSGGPPEVRTSGGPLEWLVALGDSDAHVRERGLVLARRIGAGTTGGTPVSRTQLAALVDDPSQRVRFQLALALGELPPAQSADVLADVLRRDWRNSWISAAVLSAPPTHLRRIFDHEREGFLQSAEAAHVAAQMIASLAASEDDPSRQRDVIAFVGRNPRPELLRSLGDGLRRQGKTIEKADTDGVLAGVFTTAAATAKDANARDSVRSDAIATLAFAPAGQATSALVACLGAGQSDAVQCAAITTLAERTAKEVSATLLEHWPHFGAKAKDAALAALIARDDRATVLLGAIQAGSIPATTLPAAQVQNLVQHKDAKISALAKKALAAVIPPSRAEVTAKFQPALAAKGDATRGQTIFMQRCLTCHRAGGQGMAVGPDLETVKTKGRDALLTAILEPHKEVAAQFIAYTVNTRDGAVLNGIVTNDDATSLTLKMMGGADMTIPRRNIKGSTSSGQSLMPEGLEAGLDVSGMADLLTFIETLGTAR